MSDRGIESTTRSEVLEAYADGVEAIAGAALSIGDWTAQTPCGQWTAEDLIGHLLAIVRYYGRLIDASDRGSPLADLPTGADLAEMNARDLARLEVQPGKERSEAFVELAGAHLQRLACADWYRKLGTWSRFGDLSIGDHTGVVIGEWHVHAWDLARSSGGDHRPSNPGLIASGQRVIGRAAGAGDPWIAVLLGYERDPDWRPDLPSRSTSDA